MWPANERAEERTASRQLSGAGLESMAVRYAATRDPELREQLIEAHRHLAEALAARFCRRGVPLEDLVQVAVIGLIHALDRFDPRREVKFTTYAISTVVGEIKHYFRDCTWSVKVPRQLQEITANLSRVEELLFRRLGRSPTISELALHFGVSEEEISEAMELGRVCTPYSLDAELTSETGEMNDRLQDLLGREDEHIRAVVEHSALHQALEGLERRKQWILLRRYFDEWSQSEVSRELGVSQMHVSRLEREALRELRGQLTRERAAAHA